MRSYSSYHNSHSGIFLGIVGVILSALFFLIKYEVIAFQNPLPAETITILFAAFTLIVSVMLIVADLKGMHRY
ncbi:MAG: hypothetical protein V1743_00635 [Nanoarchaeota archaeon]